MRRLDPIEVSVTQAGPLIEFHALIDSATAPGDLNPDCTTSTERRLRRQSIRDLSDDLGGLLTTGQLGDVLILAGGREFRAHKAVLTARSPVFAAMFSHELRESLENRVCIDDLGQLAVQEMLRFVYTGRVARQSLKGHVRELLHAADKYELLRLREICELEIRETLSRDTAFEVLEVAHRHGLQETKERALSIIAQNMRGLIGTEGFRRFFEGKGLCEELFLAIAAQMPSSKRRWFF